MKYNFKVRIRRAHNHEFFSVLIGKNGRTLYVSETKKRRSSTIKTVGRLFPGVEIVDETK